MRMSEQSNYFSDSPNQTEQVGALIAAQLVFPSCVYLEADMGAGKTTLCKSIIQALGYSGAVTSPTYNLIQEYPVDAGIIYHMDLYRLNDPAELEYLAITDLWCERSLFLVEWPERGAGYLLPADRAISIRKNVAKGPDYREIVLKSCA